MRYWIEISLNKVTVPIFSVAAEQDRISQWEVVYEGFKLYTTSCNQQFVLSTSGHVMGLINSPTDHKCSYKTSSYSTTNNPSPNNAMDWLEKVIVKVLGDDFLNKIQQSLP